MNQKIIFGILLGLYVPCALHGQDTKAAGEEGKAPAGRLAWFIQTSAPVGLENPVTVLSGKELVPVTLSKRSPSEPVRIPDDGILKIVRKLPPPEDETKPAYLTLAEVLVPEGVGKALIILTPAEKNAKGLLLDAKAQDLEKFRGGDSMYINMTSVRMGIELGDMKTEVEPGQTKILTGKIQDKPTNLTIRYFFQHPKKEEWKILSASTIAVYPTRREICIFSWDPRYKRIDYHGITFPVM